METLSEKEHQNIIKILKNNRLKVNIRDLYKVAYNIIAMSFDIDKNIIGIITEILESDFPPSNDFHAIILAIANGTSLDKYIKDKECLYTQELFNELKLGTLQINEFTVTPIISIIVVSFLTSFITAIYKELDRKQ